MGFDIDEEKVVQINDGKVILGTLKIENSARIKEGLVATTDFSLAKNVMF